MSRPQSTLYTKRQMEMLLARWECSEPVPKAGLLLYVCFAGQFIDLAVVEKTSLKSDRGETLWRATMSSRAGRDFDKTVQEAHVVAFRKDRIEKRRIENLARYHEVQAMAA